MPKSKPDLESNETPKETIFDFPDETPEIKAKLKKCDPDIQKCIKDWRIYLIEILKINEMLHSKNIKLKAEHTSLKLLNISLEKQLSECREWQNNYERELIEKAEEEAEERTHDKPP